MAVGILALVGFESAWERLHEIVFTNDLWLLDPRTDRLIQMFPESFWEEATFIVVGLALAEAAVLVAITGAYLWFTRPPRSEEDEPEADEATADGTDEDEPEEREEPDLAEDAPAADQEEQPQPPPPQAQPPEAPNPGSI